MLKHLILYRIIANCVYVGLIINYVLRMSLFLWLKNLPELNWA